MKTLLQIQTSMFAGGGQSSRLAQEFVAEWRKSNRNGRIIVRDIATDPKWKPVTDPDTMLVHVIMPKVEEAPATPEAAAAPTAPAEPEVIKKGKKDEEEAKDEKKDDKKKDEKKK